MKVVALFLSAAVLANSELTKETWDSAVASKSVFIKFFAPWCGHCKSMKPAWDKLMTEFKDSKTALVAEVDCTAGGKDLCSDIGVRGYPTLKHGDSNNLEDYKGGRDYDSFKKFAEENLGPSRDYDSFKKFAEENLGPTCGPANLDLCDDAKKAEIEKFSKMSPSDLEASIKGTTDAMEKLETDFNELVEAIMKQWSDANEKKDKDVAALKDSGLGLMKALAAHSKISKSEL